MIERFVSLSFCRLLGVSLVLVGEDVVPLMFVVYTLLFLFERYFDTHVILLLDSDIYSVYVYMMDMLVILLHFALKCIM